MKKINKNLHGSGNPNHRSTGMIPSSRVNALIIA